MAKILGEAGRYTTDAALRKHRHLLVTGLVGFGCLGVLLGCIFGLWLPLHRLGILKVAICELILAIASIGLGKLTLIKLEKIERERRSMRRGADGEAKVATLLAAFPDSFSVINGLSTPFGDLDHVVVGPTGVYIVDSKNWKGVVRSDGKGELLLNGNPTDKATIRPIVARTMNVREKIQILCGFEPPYFQVLLAFPSAWVDARWGTTGAALCITDEQLHEYIVDNKAPTKMNNRKIESIAQAFLALAIMDKEFKR